MTQNERVLQYMKDFGSITQAEACSDLGCYRLPARVFDLRKMGHQIRGDMISAKNRYGETVIFKRYQLEDEHAESNLRHGADDKRS